MKSDVGSPVDFRGELGAFLPADLVATVLVTLVADAVVLVEAPQTVRLAAAGALLFFLPGYAVVAALYPGASPEEGTPRERTGLGPYERLALSFGASVASVAVLGLLTWPVGIWLADVLSTGFWLSRLTPLVPVTLLVLGGCSVATVRRLRRPPIDRFSPSLGRWLSSARTTLFGGETRTDRLLSAVLVVSVLLSAGALGYAVTSPAQAEQYTSASLLTEQEDGELVAGGYPTEMQAGQSSQLVLELANREGAGQRYAVVVRLERVETSGEGSTVTEASELDRLSVGVPAGETRTTSHEVAPEMTGERLRLSYYVYRGEAPDAASPSSAYRHLYIWVAVEGA